MAYTDLTLYSSAKTARVLLLYISGISSCLSVSQGIVLRTGGVLVISTRNMA
ncbi:hypothetical protein HOY80DRAFT_979916 [Tuber brumale]|nr:hypothetical protein HOY80DRAFT_979916 [Tuber brumale]